MTRDIFNAVGQGVATRAAARLGGKGGYTEGTEQNWHGPSYKRPAIFERKVLQDWRLDSLSLDP